MQCFWECRKNSKRRMCALPLTPSGAPSCTDWTDTKWCLWGGVGRNWQVLQRARPTQTQRLNRGARGFEAGSASRSRCQSTTMEPLAVKEFARFLPPFFPMFQCTKWIENLCRSCDPTAQFESSCELNQPKSRPDVDLRSRNLNEPGLPETVRADDGYVFQSHGAQNPTGFAHQPEITSPFLHGSVMNLCHFVEAPG